MAVANEGKKTNKQADWYALRLRLATAYGLAELHLASPREPSPAISSFNPASALSTQAPTGLSTTTERVTAATALLRRLAWGRPTSVWLDARRAASTAQAVAQWGGRGWLGILRSHGL